MYPSLVLSAALLAPAAPVPRDTVPNATGPAPRVLALKADTGGAVRVVGSIPIKQTATSNQIVMDKDGKQVEKVVEYDVVTSQYFNKTLAEFNGKFATADGAPLTLDEATARVKAGATVLASADGKPVGKAWLRAVAPDTVVMVAEGLSHAQLQWGGGTLPTTPAPRLSLLTTDDKGTVLAQVTSRPVNSGNVYYDEMMWEGGGRAMRGRAVRFNGDGMYYGGAPVDVKISNKPLADVTFDAYDRTGRLLPRGEALKRLGAGGMVLVAGDNRMPDDNYLKAFHEDVLVLMASELVIPITPIDQTKKKTEPMKQPNDPNVAPAPQPLAPVAVEKIQIKVQAEKK